MATCIRKWVACSIKHGTPDVLTMEILNLFHPWLIQSLPSTLKQYDGLKIKEMHFYIKIPILRFISLLARLVQIKLMWGRNGPFHISGSSKNSQWYSFIFKRLFAKFWWTLLLARLILDTPAFFKGGAASSFWFTHPADTEQHHLCRVRIPVSKSWSTLACCFIQESNVLFCTTLR